jgi:hypothetical protein
MQETEPVALTRGELSFLDILLANTEDVYICEAYPLDYAHIIEKVNAALHAIVDRQAQRKEH